MNTNYYDTAPWSDFTFSSDSYPIQYDGWRLSADGVLTITKNVPDQPSLNQAKQKNGWMSHLDEVKEIDIRYGVTEIGDYAFCNPSGEESQLESVKTTLSLRRIGSRALKNHDQLVDIMVDAVEEFGDEALAGCSSLERIVLGSTVKKLGNRVFAGAQSLKLFEISTKATPELTPFTFDDAGRDYVPTDMKDLSRQQSSPKKAGVNTVKRDIWASVPSESFCDYAGTPGWDRLRYSSAEHGDIIVAGEMASMDKEIKYGMFILYEDGYCDISATSETLYACYNGMDHSQKPKGFWYDHAADIKTINVHDGPTELSGTFHDLPNLETVILPNSITKLSDHVYDDVTGKYNASVFQNCPKLKRVALPYVETIDDFTFSGCSSLEMIEMPRVKTVGVCAFQDCTSLETVDFAPQKIETGAFEGCTSLESIDLSGVTGDIGYQSFMGCSSLKEVVINANMVHEEAFKDCSSLETIIFGNKIWEIDQHIVDGSPLKAIYISCPRPPRLSYRSYDEYEPFSNVDCSKINCYVPAEFLPAYRDKAYWSKFNLMADPEYEEETLPIGGFLGTKGLWRLDPDGTYTYNVKGEPIEVQRDQLKWYGDMVKRCAVKDGCTGIVAPWATTMGNCTDFAIGKDVKEAGHFIEFFTDISDDGYNIVTKLKNVYVLAETPPQFTMETFQSGLDEEWAVNYAGTVLHVLKKNGVKAAYQAHEYWSKFPSIVADLEEGVDPFGDRVTIGDVSCAANGDVSVPVSINGTRSIGSAAFTVKVPEGVSVTGVSTGASASRSLPHGGPFRRSFNMGGFVIDVTPLTAQNYRVEARREDGTPLPTGELMSVKMHAAQDMVTGDFYRLRLADVTLTTTDGEDIEGGSVMTTLTVTAPKTVHGDVNSDFVVDVADIASVIDVMASAGADPVSARNADVNGDGSVDVADIAYIIDKMAASARQKQKRR